MSDSLTPRYDSAGITLYEGDILDHLDLLAAGDVLVTDPPYGMRFEPHTGGRWHHSRIVGDENTEARDAVLEAWGRHPALIFGKWSVPRPPGTRQVLTWEKGLDHGGIGDLSLPWYRNTEEIYVLGQGFLRPAKAKSAVLRHRGRPNTQPHFHPAEKPTSLLIDLLQACPPEWIILDPFAGSGTTLRAAADLGRRAIGMEIDPHHVATAIRRLGQQSLFQPA